MLRKAGFKGVPRVFVMAEELYVKKLMLQVKIRIWRATGWRSGA